MAEPLPPHLERRLTWGQGRRDGAGPSEPAACWGVAAATNAVKDED